MYDTCLAWKMADGYVRDTCLGWKMANGYVRDTCLGWKMADGYLVRTYTEANHKLMWKEQPKADKPDLRQGMNTPNVKRRASKWGGEISRIRENHVENPETRRWGVMK